LAHGAGRWTLFAPRNPARANIDPKTPIIMLTGEYRVDRVAVAIADGADSYIAKPVTAKNLMSHLVKLIAADKPVHYLD
jgi:CheY-like chemotaxis protein